MYSVLVLCSCVFFFFKQKTAYEMRISDWSSDVCSSDLAAADRQAALAGSLARGADGCAAGQHPGGRGALPARRRGRQQPGRAGAGAFRSGGALGSRLRLTCVTDRKSVVEGKSGSGRVDLRGRPYRKKKKTQSKTP